MASSDLKQRKRDKKKHRERPLTLRSVLSSFSRNILSAPFLSDAQMPQDYCRREDYIDLKMIQEKETEGGYCDCPELFAEEMRKMWEDALRYFPPQHRISEYARCLQQDFERVWANFEASRDPVKRLALRIEALERMLQEATERLERQERTNYTDLSARTVQRLNVAIQRLSSGEMEVLVDLLRDYIHHEIGGRPVFSLSRILIRDYRKLKEFLKQHRAPAHAAPLPATSSWFVLSADQYRERFACEDDSEDSEEDRNSEEEQEEERIVVSALPV